LKPAAFAMLTLVSSTASAGDPRLQYFTVENEAVVVHFHGGLEETAQRVAAYAAELETSLTRWLGRAPSQKTEIVLKDASDHANGFAGTLPYSAIELFVTAPTDMSVLGAYDEWIPTLLSHEQTHIVHIDNVSGLPALVNTVLGKQFAPNQLQPRWLIEGMAVYSETVRSSAGRLRSPFFDMMLRADVVDDHFASLDQVTGDPKRWPGGNLYYLYGAKFVQFLAELYGESLFTQIANDSGDDIVPFAVSRPFYRATGRTVEELYGGFRSSTFRRVKEQLAPVFARGLREGRRLTFHGRHASSPRFYPRGCGDAGTDASRTLVYARDDGHERSGIYRLSFGAGEAEARLLTRASGETVSVARDCRLYFDSIAPSRRRYDFLDLFRLEPGVEAPSGVEAGRERLTVGRRLSSPDVAPDGKTIVYVTNRAGTTTLRIARLLRDGGITEERALVAAVRDEQVFTPRFSHDGRWVAYGTWTRGGFRDIRIVEVSTGKVTELFRDRAVDQQPSFSPDDRRVYFSSDRSGIPNIYAYDLATSVLRQITNVRIGAFMPEVSADGKTLAYVGYGTSGFDLYALDLEDSQELEPLTNPIPRGDRPYLASRAPLPIRPYSPWPTLRPRALEIDYRSDASGQRLILAASGADVVGYHGIDANVVFEPEGNSPDVYTSYSYSRLPVGLNVSAYRVSDPNLRYEYGTRSSQIDEIRLGASSGLSYGIPAEFSSQSVSLSYGAESVSSELPTGLGADPYGTVPHDPRRGIKSALRLSYAFSNTEGTTYGSGSERGISLRLSLDEAHRGLGSELEGTTVTGRTTGYVLLPWSRHHVLALSGHFGAGTGQAGSGFALGGYQDSGLLRGVLDGIGQSRVTLRGYPSGRFRGSRLLLGQAEYRAPLFVVDRGISTLPVFLRSVHAAIGFDAGGAFERYEPSEWERQFHYGLSAELWLDFVFSYRLSTRLLLGYAAGRGEGAIDGGTSYLVVGSGL
jgi:hypothetical protein